MSEQQPVASGSRTRAETALNDALDGVVDMKAEEELAQQQLHQAPIAPVPSARVNASKRNLLDENSRHKRSNFLDFQKTREKMVSIAKAYGTQIQDDDSVTLMALAAESRVKSLVTAFISAKEHRINSSYLHAPPMYDDEETPMWSEVVKQDPGKQVRAIEKIQKEEESKRRRERMIRDDLERNRAIEIEREKEASALEAEYGVPLAGESSTNGASANGGEGGKMDGVESAGGSPAGPAGTQTPGQPPAKKKKPNTATNPKNLSEDVRKQQSNMTAMRSAGLPRKSWMMGGGAGAASPSPLSRVQKGKIKENGGAPGSPASLLGSPLSANNKSFMPVPSGLSNSTTNDNNNIGTAGGGGGGWAKSFLSTGSALASTAASASQATSAGGDLDYLLNPNVTMRDALFVLEREKGHGAGRSSASKVVGRALIRKRDDY